MSDPTDATPRPRPRREKTPSAYRIDIVRKRCTGVGTCMEVASRTFDMDDEAIAFVRDPDGNPSDIQLEAAQSCPVDAIFLYDKITGEKVWPLREKRFPKPE